MYDYPFIRHFSAVAVRAWIGNPALPAGGRRPLAPLRDQAATAYVTGMCGSGCATVDLAVDRKRTSPASLCSPVVSADTPMVDGRPSFGLLVFLDEGWLGELEIYYYDAPPPEFPAPEVFNSPGSSAKRPSDIGGH